MNAEMPVRVAEPIVAPSVPQTAPFVPTVDPGRRLAPDKVCPEQKEVIVRKVKPAVPGED